VILLFTGQSHFSVDAQVPVPRNTGNLFIKPFFSPALSLPPTITLFFPQRKHATMAARGKICETPGQQEGLISIRFVWNL